MNNNNSGRLVIQRAGNILTIAGVIWLLINLAYGISEMILSNYQNFNFDFSPLLFAVIPGLILRGGGYLAARRVAFFAGFQ